MKKVLMTATAMLAFGAAAMTIEARAALDTSQIHVKKAIADTMTAEQLQAYKERLAAQAASAQVSAKPASSTLAPADTCAATTPEIGALPYNPPADTTVGMVDDFDLPADTTTPTCTASSNCTGAGPAGSLPRGAVYNLTGTGPDRAYQLITDQSCTVSITMDPTTATDMGLIVYQAACSSLLSDCVCVDDTGFAGDAESVLLDAVAGTTYFAVVDGYGGANGPFTISVSETTTTGCDLVPVELQSFSID